MQEAQALAPDDPGHADGILRESEAAPPGCTEAMLVSLDPRRLLLV
jgi:hypothetical protein